MATPGPGRSNLLWILIIVAVVVVLAIWFFASTARRDETIATTLEPAYSGFVIEPSGPAVPVTLPTTPMTPTVTSTPAGR